MKVAVALLLVLGAAGTFSAELVPVQPLMPVNPKHTFAEWEAIMARQTPTPERCEGCKPGQLPQPSIAGRVSAIDTRIIGGDKAPAKRFPWQVQVEMDSSYFCGGSIISNQWILSAGHCVDGFSSWVITLGTIYTQTRDPARVVISSRTAIRHQDYDPDNISDDISVIKLSRAVQLSDTIRPVRLPSLSDVSDPLVGAESVLSGWGRYGTTTVSPSISDQLRCVKLSVISNALCAQSFGSYILSSNICTAGSSQTGGPVGACNGDSGGALTVKKNNVYKQVGIVSFGTSAGCNVKYPSVFTRVASYLKWISSKTGISIES